MTKRIAVEIVIEVGVSVEVEDRDWSALGAMPETIGEVTIWSPPRNIGTAPSRSGSAGVADRSTSAAPRRAQDRRHPRTHVLAGLGGHVGHGTGALRQAIRSHLHSHKAIERFRSGEQNEGGDGVTVAFLRG